MPDITPVLCVAILGIVSATTAQADFSPFQTRDQNPFNLIHGQPLPINAKTAAAGELRWRSSLAVTNTLNSQQLADESIYLDVESYRLNLGLQYGLNENWAVNFDLPLIHKGAGFLDSVINSWHKLFNLPQASRPTVENDQYRIQRTLNGSTLTDLQSADTGIGDLQLGLGHTLYVSQQSRLSVWAGLKLPTGNPGSLNSNGAIDASIWLAANKQPAEHWRLNTNVGLVLPAVYVTGHESPYNTDLEQQVFFGHIMLAWQAMDWLDLKIQLQGHTAYYNNSNLRLLGSTYLATFGGSLHLNSCNSLDIGVSEDIKVEASPDVSFLFSWRHFDDCRKTTGP